MKKLYSWLLVLILIISLIPGCGCSAGEITVTLNGKTMELEQNPVIEEGRTLVPLRAIFEGLGAEVLWDEATRTVKGTLSDKSVELVIDKKEASVNGAKTVLDVPPCIKNGRTLVPVRFVSESLGADVEWNADTRNVIISYRNGLKAIFADVGQGDCQLIMCDGQTMLIDGGTADKSNTVVAILNKNNVSFIDYIVCTHAHADHCGGLAGALRNFDVGAVLAPKTEEDSKAYQNFVDGAEKQGIEIINPQPGYSFPFGGGKVTVLGPVNESSSDINNTSIVMRLVYGNNAFLFTGDCEASEEKDILATGAELSADVLKVGHHGSEYSSTYSFLREVMPKYAIIGVGKDNIYGHPTEEALSRLRDVGAQVFRTDLQGDVTVMSDGSTISVETYKNSTITTTPVTTPSEMSYIGNVRSKKFHKSTCSGLPNEENRTYFTSRADAVNGGYVPCKNCNP